MIFNVSNAKASTNLNPNPGSGEFQDGYWDVDAGDIYAYESKKYIIDNGDDILIEKNHYVFNISEMSYGPNQWIPSSQKYQIDVIRMFWNASSDQLEEMEVGGDGFIWFNFTWYAIQCGGNALWGDMLDLPTPLVLPKNKTDDVPMGWFAKAYNYTLKWNDIIDPTIFIDSDNNETKFTWDDSYVHFIYDEDGVLKTAEYKDGDEKTNVTRTTNFCPVDEVKWSVKKGDKLYFGGNTDEYKIDIVDIINWTVWDTSFELVTANKSVWNSDTEKWDLLESWEQNQTYIGWANEYDFYYDGLVIPIGITGEDLAGEYLEIWYDDDNFNFEEPQYGDLWFSLENPSTGEFINYTYFPAGDPNEGVVKYWYEGFEPEYYHEYTGNDFGFSRGDQFVYEITIFDETALDYFFDDWGDTDVAVVCLEDSELGAKEKIEVWDIDEDYYGWDISFDIWSWTTEDFGAEPDDGDDVWVESDAKYARELPTWFCVIPVNGYISDLDVDELEEWDWLYVENNKLNASTSDKNDYNISIEYDTTKGVVDKFQILNNTGVYYEIQLTDHILSKDVPDDFNTTLIYWKNVTDWDIGVHHENYNIGADFNFTIDLELNSSTEVSFTAFYESPIEDEALSDSIIYFDLFITNSSAIEFPINITIEIPATSKTIKVFYYNDATEKWEAVDYTRVGNIITIQLDHASIFSITAKAPSRGIIPGAADDDDDDDDKEEIIPFGNFYLLFIAIGIIGLVIYTKRKNFKKL